MKIVSLRTIFVTLALLALPVLPDDPRGEPVIILDFNPTEGTSYIVRLAFDGWEVNRIEVTNWFIDERDIFYTMQTNRLYQMTITPVVLGQEILVQRVNLNYHYKITNEIVEPLPPQAPIAPKGVTIKD
jgi:hypothetical protein